MIVRYHHQVAFVDAAFSERSHAALSQFATDAVSPMRSGNGEMLQVATTTIRPAQHSANDQVCVSRDEAEASVALDIRRQWRARVGVSKRDAGGGTPE
jgi:hypothetical protein